MVELEVREFLRLTVVRGGRHFECSFQACYLRSCWLKFSRRYIRVSFPLAQAGIGRWWRHDAHTHTHTHTLNYFTHAHILANIFAVSSFFKSSLFCSESQRRSSQKVHIAVATLQKPKVQVILYIALKRQARLARTTVPTFSPARGKPFPFYLFLVPAKNNLSSIRILDVPSKASQIPSQHHDACSHRNRDSNPLLETGELHGPLHQESHRPSRFEPLHRPDTHDLQTWKSGPSLLLLGVSSKSFYVCRA